MRIRNTLLASSLFFLSVAAVSVASQPDESVDDMFSRPPGFLVRESGMNSTGLEHQIKVPPELPSLFKRESGGEFLRMYYFHNQDPDPLAKHHWQHRVLLLFAEAPTSSVIQEQLSLLRKQPNELTDRDLVIYQIGVDQGVMPSGKKLSSEDILALRQKYAADQPAFRFILIGKDGGEKWRTDQRATTDELFNRIDRMPMRRAEMRRQKKDDEGGGKK